MKQILYLETIFRCAFLLAAVLSASLLHAGDLYKMIERAGLAM